MASVEIYTTKTCPYCVKAKRLLDAKDVDYAEIDVTGDEAARDALVKKSGGFVPSRKSSSTAKASADVMICICWKTRVNWTSFSHENQSRRYTDQCRPCD